MTLLHALMTSAAVIQSSLAMSIASHQEHTALCSLSSIKWLLLQTEASLVAGAIWTCWR